ncbi:MAG: cell division FtsA domain-containing protein [bacterium]
MKLPKLFPKKKKKSDEKVLLALDIGTEFVKAVLFTVDNIEVKVKIKGYGVAKQNSNAMQGAMIVNLESVIKAADRAVGEALQNADKLAKLKLGKDNVNEFAPTPVPEKVIIGIAGELVQGVTIMADYERETPQAKITAVEVNEVINQIKEQAFEDAVTDIAAEIGVDIKSLEEINSKINSTYIDGVKVDNPEGFTGTKVGYKVFSTFAPSIHVNSLREIAYQLGLEILSIEVEPYAIARALKGGRKQDYNAIILDVGGGTTDVAVIKEGAVAGTKMFAYGGRVFTKRIAKDLAVDLHEAEQMKIDYSLKQLDKAAEIQVKKAIGKDIQIWAEGVELALDEIDDIDKYPGSIYLCGGGSALPEIKEALIEHPWLQVLPFLSYPKVNFLFPNQLEDIIDETNLIIDPRDIPPVALARMVLEL